MKVYEKTSPPHTQLVTICCILFLTIIFGCQKNTGHLSNNLSEKHIQLVPLDSARKIAVNLNPSIYYNIHNPQNHNSYVSKLDGNNQIKDYIEIKDKFDQPAMYVFNFTNNNGFVFVSADYQLEPLLGYIEHGEFRKDTVPSGLIQWGNKTLENIDLLREGLYDNSKSAKRAWSNYFQENQEKQISGTRSGVHINGIDPLPDPGPCETDPNYYSSVTYTAGPLLPVTWGQSCTYNDSCPNKTCNDCSPLAVTGCVATSMAQVIRYWQPSNSYNYNYSSMPATIGNSEVQRLMHDAGVSVSMSYGCAANGGSSAYGSNVPGALINNFGFVSASRSNYGTSSYITVKNNISNNWPVLLEGCNDQTNVFLGIWYTYQNCHEWVCDGYQQTDITFCMNGNEVKQSHLSFHMNWGWHEVGSPNDYNGWFAFNNWAISGAGQGGSAINFQYAREMVTSIHP